MEGKPPYRSVRRDRIRLDFAGVQSKPAFFETNRNRRNDMDHGNIQRKSEDVSQKARSAGDIANLLKYVRGWLPIEHGNSPVGMCLEVRAPDTNSQHTSGYMCRTVMLRLPEIARAVHALLVTELEQRLAQAEAQTKEAVGAMKAE